MEQIRELKKLVAEEEKVAEGGSRKVAKNLKT